MTGNHVGTYEFTAPFQKRHRFSEKEFIKEKYQKKSNWVNYNNSETGISF